MNRQVSLLGTLVAFGLTTSMLLISPNASAVSKCGDQTHQSACGASNPFPCCSNGGNCTWWAWEAACRNWHVNVPFRHDAKTWAAEAKSNPNYKVLDHPVVGSIGVYDEGKWGHVAWITGVQGDKVTVSEEKCMNGYGLQHNTYYASQFTGGFIVRADYQEGSSSSGGGSGCAAMPSPSDPTGPVSGGAVSLGMLGLWMLRRKRNRRS